MNITLVAGANLPASMMPDIQLLNYSTANTYLNHTPASTFAAITSSQLHYGTKNLLPKSHLKEASLESMMITKSEEGYYVVNNITLKVSHPGDTRSLDI